MCYSWGGGWLWILSALGGCGCSCLPVGLHLPQPGWDKQECLLTARHLASPDIVGGASAGQLWKPWLPSRLPLKPPWQGGGGTPHYPWVDLETQTTNLVSAVSTWEGGSPSPLSKHENLASYTAFSHITLRLGCLITASLWQKSRLPTSLCWHGDGVWPQFFLCCLPEVDRLLSKSLSWYAAAFLVLLAGKRKLFKFFIITFIISVPFSGFGLQASLGPSLGYMRL